ncbi:iron ABC transporter permease [Microcella daejeonensis]|uniref:FecCD family ABC transporter permease n=1 Tax=Microcella daejeonensis TaxID=2994971 RepID=UPI00227094C3|nr:iron ABC transporter permease [Microcella daejeonensis]WAB84581.1 iron ABC transporter permease [Microcella daejeonensis]
MSASSPALAPPAPAPRRPGIRSGRRLLGAGALLGGLLVAVALSLAVGARATDPIVAVLALVDPAALGPDSVDAVVVRELRIPRTVIGLLAGAALGVAGIVMQGVTRNPIADPGLLGVTAGASFAVVLGIAAAGVTSVVALAGFSLLGALAAAALIAAIAATSRVGSDPALLVVAGAAVTAGLSSITTLVLLGDPETLDRYRFWTVGSLTGRDLDGALALAPLIAVGIVGAALLARALDALALGDDVARGLGFRLAPTRAAAIAAIVVLAGAATAIAGPIVFVGLVGAHAARVAVGGSHLARIPVAAVAGAALVLIADVLGRLVVPPGELEAGIVIAALGAPLLILLVRSREGLRA